MDHVGPIARTVEDIEMLLAALSPRLAQQSRPGISSGRVIRLGICPYFFKDIRSNVETAVLKAISLFEEAGFEIIEQEMSILPEALHASDIISRAEAVTVHDRGLTHNPDAYGPLVRARLTTGYEVSGLDLVRAYRTRNQVTQAFRRIFNKVDFLAAPAVPVTAPPIGTDKIRIGSHEESIVTSFVRLNAPQNVAGIPALVVPCGFDPEGLPIGLQLVAWRNRDSLLLDLGKLFQQWTDWHRATPPEQPQR